MAVKERVRFGGRSARIQKEVHRAVEELSPGGDRSQLTVPAIAARAGVTPSTIYRRWGDLSELLADVAVQRLRPIADPEDTDSTRGDLEAFIVQFMEEMSSKVGRSLLRDVLSSAADGGYAEQCWRFTTQHLDVIAARAVARGEAAFDTAEIVDHVVAPIIYHILYGDRELGVDYCRGLLARIDIGARAPVAA